MWSAYRPHLDRSASSDEMFDAGTTTSSLYSSGNRTPRERRVPARKRFTGVTGRTPFPARPALRTVLANRTNSCMSCRLAWARNALARNERAGASDGHVASLVNTVWTVRGGQLPVCGIRALLTDAGLASARAAAVPGIQPHAWSKRMFPPAACFIAASHALPSRANRQALAGDRPARHREVSPR